MSDPADTSVLDLVREDLRAFGGYASARTSGLTGEIWLNANEAAWGNPGDPDAQCRRYPEPQPEALQRRLAALYGVAPEQLLIGRGSDEAIDLLVRALCVPGRDAVLATPPVFGMYAVSARLQGAALREVPLVDGDAGFAVDLDAVVRSSSSTRPMVNSPTRRRRPRGSMRSTISSCCARCRKRTRSRRRASAWRSAIRP